MGFALTSRVRPWVFVTVTGLLTLAAIVLLVLRPADNITYQQILSALAEGLGFGEADRVAHVAIVYDVRLPRVLVTVFAGASLAVAGTVMQAVFRNPLGAPEILGTMNGAALGAVMAIGFGFASTSVFAAPICSFLMAGAVTALVFASAWGRGGASVTGILLAGIAMNSLAGAAIAFIVSLQFGSWEKSKAIMQWLLGGLDKATVTGAWIVGLGFVLFSAVLVPFVRDMDLLTLKDESAQTLGVRVGRMRQILLLIACGVTATAVANTGGILFVGLVVPHMVRLMVGPSHRALLPCAAIAGALILIVADGLCQLAGSQAELRAGVVTSILGVPFFLLLLMRHRRAEVL